VKRYQSSVLGRVRWAIPFLSFDLGTMREDPLFYADKRSGLPAYCVSKCAKSRRRTMKVLLTGGSGNLGHVLVPKLLDKGDTPIILDIRAPLHLQKGAVFIEGSILDRPKLTEIFRGCDCIVHIAAWHGIHEDRSEKNPHDFFDLNVRGEGIGSQ
jgi:hypothetical protein